MRWKVPCVTIKGLRHSQEGINCQDFINANVKDFVCVAMADGAGSAKNAGIGAKLVVEKTREYLTTLNVGVLDCNFHELCVDLITELRIMLHAQAREIKSEFESFASTLLFFFTDGEHYLAGNLGDGIVGVINERNYAEVLLGPEHGDYFNQSFFVTDDDSEQHLRLCSGEFDEKNIYFLMTDGSCDCLYNRQSKAFADALGIYADWLRVYSRVEVERAIKTSMYKLFTQITSDDCALALVKGENRS